MKKPSSGNSSDSSLAWHSLYQAALFESDREKIPAKIDAGLQASHCVSRWLGKRTARSEDRAAHTEGGT